MSQFLQEEIPRLRSPGLKTLGQNTCKPSSSVTREAEGGRRTALGDTPFKGGNTLMKVEIFLRVNLQECWINDHLERRSG